MKTTPAALLHVRRGVCTVKEDNGCKHLRNDLVTLYSGWLSCPARDGSHVADSVVVVEGASWRLKDKYLLMKPTPKSIVISDL